MKKLITLGCLILGIILFTETSFAQENNAEVSPVFQEGDLVINAGIGLGTTYSWGGGLGLPFGAGVEYGITNLETGSIGVGGDFGMVSGSGLTITYLGAKGSYHFNELLELENDKLDVYGGLGLYYRSFNWDNTFSNTSGNGLVAGFHVGGRYYFADNIGGYAELGNNWAWLNAGVIFKL